MQPQPAIERRFCDVLVLGAGLAGMRAAVAAKSLHPRLDVALLTASPKPSGSSFANRNDALGVQAPADDHQREAFVREVLDLAPPGEADPILVQTLAREAFQRCRELVDLGLDFQGRDGAQALFTGCFSPHAPRALVFTGLSRAFERFAAWAESTGVAFWPGMRVTGLAASDDGVRGAAAVGVSGPTLIRARAVVLALGGPSGLFAWSLAGPRLGGESYGLLRHAGAQIRNAGFLQFFWTSARSKQFVQLGRVFQPGLALLDAAKRPFDPFAGLDQRAADRLLELARVRDAHCPAGYDLPDSSLDALLKKRLDARGLAEVRAPGGETMLLAPMAHAGNGGALVDDHARTTVPGLFACGECATGMHGANRMGGAMVAATQVFGKRAGEAAAEAAASTTAPRWEHLEFGGEPDRAIVPAGALGELRRRMQADAVLGGTPRLGALLDWIRSRRPEAAGAFRLQLLTAETMVEHLMDAWARLRGDPLAPQGPAAALARQPAPRDCSA